MELPGPGHPAGVRALMLIVLAAAWLAGGGASAAVASPPARPDTAGTHTVIIEGMRFHPEKIVVRRGEKIKWINKDPFPHTVTAADGRFDSGVIAPDGTWTYVPGKAGEYDYRCTFHPTMKGRLIVR
ncbi:MAG TPA: cupredoxin family copper-binding protein [Steroidobacteraceae bacterium]